MRTVVTGASGDVGWCLIPELLRRGHDVRGLSGGQHTLRATGYRHTRADVRDVDALVQVMTDGDGPVDAVVADANSAPAVVDAAERAGVPRLVVTSSVLADQSHTDGLVNKSGLNSLLVRAAIVMGRDSAGASLQRFAAPVTLGVKGAANTLQFIHPDDLGRFLGDAVERPEWTGAVNLAAGDGIGLRTVAAILGKRYIEVNPDRVAAALRFLADRKLLPFGPEVVEAMVRSRVVDTTRLRDEFGFAPAWTSRECVEDFARSNRDHIFLGSRRVSVPWRVSWARVPPPPEPTANRRLANDEGVSGEFDTSLHPDWPVFTAANSSEAFPGPMTPLSLELSLESLRAAGVQSADVLRVDGEIRRVLVEEQTGAFGHGVYANLTVLFAVTAALPGSDRASWGSMLFGEGAGADVPELDAIGAWGMAKRMPWILAKVGACVVYEIRRVDAEARRQQHDAGYYAGLTDDQLAAQMLCVRDEVANAWAIAAPASLLTVLVMSLIEKQAGEKFATQIKGGTEKLASAGLSRGTHDLALLVRVDPSISGILQAHEHEPEAALKRLREVHPEFVARLDAVVTEHGHRGPGETELINPVFADSPARLLDIVAKLAGTTDREVEPMPAMSLRLRVLARMGAGFHQAREQVRDAAVRRTHSYRLIAREIGARLARRGLIAEVDDVFYLIRDELMRPPPDIGDRVERRKAERARLHGDRPPLNFVGQWKRQRDHVVPELETGESLKGIPVSAGIAKGPVRVLTPDSANDLEPGEVLVTALTDAGWTPFFSYAAAVVVDIGGEMSHAAVVAREFGIPCVVGSLTGSRALRTGHIVEVDGSSGRITRVE
jgi:nucleoside-diphosphate-sugar epimerase/phosphohistidine swiveling domain-containing protein